MKHVEELKIWSSLSPKCSRPALESCAIGDVSHDFSKPCTILGGRNGAGKSRVLRSLAAELGDSGLILDMHHLSEQAMILLRSREDIEDMADETGFYVPSDERSEDLRRIIGRNYQTIEWSQVDLIPAEDHVAETFKWSGDQPLVPYFRVAHGERTYSSLDMGLGEFAMHFMFWILEQYDGTSALTLLLDEPDAFLPPVGVQSLLHRLLILCKKRGWQLILTTHSQEMIELAADHDLFTLLYLDATGNTLATSVVEERHIASTLLARPTTTHTIVCEDESASHLIKSIIRNSNALQLDSVSMAWVRGAGNVTRIRELFLNPGRMSHKFLFVLDGDQWDKVSDVPQAWPLRFLPTTGDPDLMFREAMRLDALASRLRVGKSRLAAFLDLIEAAEPHDWTNQLAEEFGRQEVLGALADAWVEMHPALAAEFADQLTLPDSIMWHSTHVAEEAR